MQINNINFAQPLEDILSQLRFDLHSQGIKLLEKEPKHSGLNNIQCQCIYHSFGNEKKPSFGINKNTGICHCFRAGTKVLTKQGSKNIEDLIYSDSTILNGNGEWENVRFSCYGKSSLMKIVLSQDRQMKVIYATPEHEWFLHKNKYTVLPTNLLDTGMVLSSCISKNIDYNFNLEGFIHGIIYGDGCRLIKYVKHRIDGSRVNDKSLPKGCYYEIHIPKFTKKSSLVNYFNLHDDWSVKEFDSRENYFTAYSKVFDINHNYKLPPHINDPHDYKMSFLSGYFATDGSIDLNNISCANFSMLNYVRDICISCNISVRDIKSVTRTNSYVDGKHTLYILPILRESLPDKFYVLESDLPKRKYCRSRWRVVSVEYTDLIEDVYCCITSTNSFVLDGNILTHNCFTCDKTVSLDEFISNCFGYNDGGAMGWSWLLQNFIYTENGDIKIDFNSSSTDLPDSSVSYVSEEELDTYRFEHSYWAERGITDADLKEFFDLGYDKETRCITMPNHDIDGNCLFVARRSVNYKYFNYPANVQKQVYGIYQLYQYNPFPKEVWITESMIDCLRLWQNGKFACALNGLGNRIQFQQLIEMPCISFVLATDMDKAGRDARKRIRDNVKGHIFYEVQFEKKDIGELTDEQILKLKPELF